MTRSLFALVLAALLPACSSASPSDPGASLRSGQSCTPPLGSYLFHYEEQANGTCGPIPDQLQQLGGSSGAAAGNDAASSCDMANDADPQTCTVRYTVKCGTARNVGYMDWSPDGTHGEGETTLSSPTCSSTYRMTAKRR